MALKVFLKLIEIDKDGEVSVDIQADRAVRAADEFIGRLKSWV